jgi:hypothetical protein
MNLAQQLDRLDVRPARGYYESRIPSPSDSEIARAVNAFTEAGPHDQAQFRAALDAGRSGLLQAWSERIAALAVRLDSERPLVLGLVGLSLAAGEDAHEAALVAPLHRRSAEKLGIDATLIFDDAAAATDPDGAAWLEEMRDSDEQPEDAGYVEDADADGFRYQRAHALGARDRYV